MSVGDEPGVLRATWGRALSAARRAYERAEQTVGEVARLTRERLARLWNVTAQAVDSAKQAVRDVLARAVEAAKTAVQAAAVVLGGLLAASAGVMFSGWVILAAFAVWYLSGKKGD
jgi:excinuclease UvrABC nuclease subunit